MSHWKISMDTGGTFTDCIAQTPQGDTKHLKILSSSVIRIRVDYWLSDYVVKVSGSWPVEHDLFKNFTLRLLTKREDSFIIQSVDLVKSEITLQQRCKSKPTNLYAEITSHEEVPVFAARLLTSTPLHKKFPFIELRLGSTRGTNALLERKGSSTALIVTKGFKDLLIIGDQQRPNLFALAIQKPQPLYHYVFEVDERLDAQGKIKRKLNREALQQIIKTIKRKKLDSVAVALLHSYKNPAHEQRIYRELRKSKIHFVSLSHHLSPEIKIVPRAQTAVVNAYLHPVIHHYLSGIQKKLQSKQFQVMSSAGGLLPVETFQPKDSLLSGPAGGVLGAFAKGQQSGKSNIITFDMGGTSTDVSLCNNRVHYRYECRVGDFTMFSPTMAIETIAAGGGSICDFDGFRLIVGPHSAGANPGPACYGAGGPLTITDVNLLLGRLDENHFAIPVYKSYAQAALDKIVWAVNQKFKKKISQEEIVLAFIQIANEKMAEAIRKVSVQQGYDPIDFSLLSFGGAGGQHACSLADMLKINSIIVPYEAGLLSAYGIQQATIEKIVQRQLLLSLDDFQNQQNQLFTDLESEAKKFLLNECYDSSELICENKFIFMRLVGQETSIEIEQTGEKSIVELFKVQYKKIYGNWIDRPIEIERIRVRVIVKHEVLRKPSLSIKSHAPTTTSSIKIWDNNQWNSAKVYRWENLKPGAQIQGTALIISNNATVFVQHNWRFALNENNTGILTCDRVGSKQSIVKAEAAQLELYTNRFTAVAQEMGAMLQRTAFSVNVKERLDFSCALLDADGKLIVNAPHIPVHLGSLGVCVREVAGVIPPQAGDVIITNHPAFGGSHLPDITLIKPVFYKNKHIGYAANRAHHAEIGGKQPGSMPADATRLVEEGVIISPTWLMRNGKPMWSSIEAIFKQAPYPTRAWQENLADLQAAFASLIHGEEALLALCNEFGVQEVTHYMQLLCTHASSFMVSTIKKLNASLFYAQEKLDDGSWLRVRIQKNKNRLRIDFSGTSGVHPGNLNATRAIVNSVILYVLRLWINEPLPLNEGLLEPVDIILPICLLNPNFSVEQKNMPAVVGGNTEVSQRLTDTLLKALKLSACSQGTMNNVLFGNERFGYYETICGGTGATNGYDGASAVHQHMTNTRITDPEIMELRYPISLNQFSVRKNSGGKGKWRGGDGVVREIYFNDTLSLTVLTQHRIEEPYGMRGGKSGKRGKQYLIRKNGILEKLKPIDGTQVYSGDRLIIETPGGGGWGSLR